MRRSVHNTVDHEHIANECGDRTRVCIQYSVSLYYVYQRFPPAAGEAARAREWLWECAIYINTQIVRAKNCHCEVRLCRFGGAFSVLSSHWWFIEQAEGENRCACVCPSCGGGRSEGLCAHFTGHVFPIEQHPIPPPPTGPLHFTCRTGESVIPNCVMCDCKRRRVCVNGRPGLSTKCMRRVLWVSVMANAVKQHRSNCISENTI